MIDARPLGLLVVLAVALPILDAAAQERVLVFSKTAGFRHTSIDAGVQALRALGEAHGFEVDHTEDGGAFNASSLDRYDVVVFLSTSGDVLDAAQQSAFQAYVRAGGGYVGVHAAATTEYDWPWYGRLVGAYFDDHPAPCRAEVVVADTVHPATAHLPLRWERFDEWYNFREKPREQVQVLLTLDEASYEGGTMGVDHPIAWVHRYEGGRAFYTGLGHTEESYREPLFLDHLLGGIRWAARNARSPD